MPSWLSTCTEEEFNEWEASDEHCLCLLDGERAYLDMKFINKKPKCTYASDTKEFWSWMQGYGLHGN